MASPAVPTSISIGSDHAGFELKAAIMDRLLAVGTGVRDVGTYDTRPVDYPDYAVRLALSVIANSQPGILICGSGVGAAVAANKVHGIRAGIAHDTYSAHQGVEHDNMNVLVLGARVIGVELAMELVTTFLAAKFSKEDRHVRRLGKISRLENTEVDLPATFQPAGEIPHA